MDLTLATVSSAIPKDLQISQKMIDELNDPGNEPEVSEAVRENFMCYANVLKDGKYKLDEYFNAVRYCTFRLMGHNIKESYSRAFPQRYHAMMAAGRDAKYISSITSIYNKGKLVSAIMDQAQVAVWVQHHNVFNEAILTQADLMRNAKSEMVRTQAATSLITALKRPEKLSVPEKVTEAEVTNTVAQLGKTLADIISAQQQMIQNGLPTKAVASMRIIDAEIVENDTDA